MYSNGTLVKSNSTSKETIWKRGGTWTFFIVVRNSLLLETVYSEVLHSDSSFAQYIARWYVAVLRVEIIGHIGNFSKRNLKSLLPSTAKANIGFTDKKLSTCFQIKDQTKFEHLHDIIHLGTCPEDNCSENYIGESRHQTSGKIMIKIKNHRFSNIALKNAANTFTITVLK